MARSSNFYSSMISFIFWYQLQLVENCSCLLRGSMYNTMQYCFVTLWKLWISSQHTVCRQCIKGLLKCPRHTSLWFSSKHKGIASGDGLIVSSLFLIPHPCSPSTSKTQMRLLFFFFISISSDNKNPSPALA